jgi:ketosteroid isomerase-like protein
LRLAFRKEFHLSAAGTSSVVPLCLAFPNFEFFVSNPPYNRAKLTNGGAMRNLVLLVGVLASFVISASGQETSDRARAAIRKVMEEQQAAWNRHDLEGFMAGYWNSPELTFFSGAHESKGWQAALDRYKKNYQGAGHEMGKLEFANLRIEMLGPEAAFVRGEFHLTMPDGKTPHGLFTLIFREFPEGWKIVHDHSAGE